MLTDNEWGDVTKFLIQVSRILIEILSKRDLILFFIEGLWGKLNYISGGSKVRKVLWYWFYWGASKTKNSNSTFCIFVMVHDSCLHFSSFWCERWCWKMRNSGTTINLRKKSLNGKKTSGLVCVGLQVGPLIFTAYNCRNCNG